GDEAEAEEIGEHEGAAAILAGGVGEAPDIAETDGGSDGGHDEPESGRPGLTLAVDPPGNRHCVPALFFRPAGSGGSRADIAGSEQAAKGHIVRAVEVNRHQQPETYHDRDNSRAPIRD